MLIDIVLVILNSLNITVPRGTLLYNLSAVLQLEEVLIRTGDIMKAFSHDHDFLPRDRINLHGLCNDFLRGAVGVGICSVPGVNALIICRFQDGQRFGLFNAPGEPLGVAEGHGAEDGVRDAEAGGAEAGKLYTCSRSRHSDFVMCNELIMIPRVSSGLRGGICLEDGRWWRLPWVDS